MARKRIQKNPKGVSFPKMKLSFMSKYYELLKVKVLHDYFSAGVLSKMIIRPTPATIEFFARNTIQFRGEAGGFTLGYAATESFNPIKDLDKPVSLSFFLEMTDSKFFNYTDLPFDLDDTTIFYFNNKALEKDTTEKRNLSIDAFVEQQDKIDILAPLFQHRFDEPQDGVQVQVMNAVEEIVYEYNANGGVMSVPVNLSGYPEGKYSLLVDGFEEYSFYLYAGLKRVFGAIDIVLDKDDIGDYAFYTDEGEVVKQEYVIHFKQRSVRWKYLFVETGSEQMHFEHDVYDANRSRDYQEVYFENAEEEHMEDGRTIQTVWSSGPIPFSEVQPQDFKLKTRKGKAGIEWVTELPCASAKNDLKVNGLDKEEVYSELIVYL